MVEKGQGGACGEAQRKMRLEEMGMAEYRRGHQIWVLGQGSSVHGVTVTWHTRPCARGSKVAMKTVLITVCALDRGKERD